MCVLLQGLALINGTQLITGLGAEALFRAELIAKQADVVAALTLDVLQGTPRAFDYGRWGTFGVSVSIVWAKCERGISSNGRALA